MINPNTLNYNIILLDTDAKHANAIKDHLKAYSEYSIHVFTNFSECIAQLQMLKPAVIFLDAELNHDKKTINADKELMFHLKELSPNSEIVLYSGEEKLELMSDHVKSGAHGFTIKSTHTHVKAEMLLLSAIRQFKLNKNLRLYKMLTVVFAVTLIAVIIFTIIAYKTNVITDEVQGPFDN